MSRLGIILDSINSIHSQQAFQWHNRLLNSCKAVFDLLFISDGRWWWRGCVGGVRGLKKFRLSHREHNLQRRRFALESRRPSLPRQRRLLWTRTAELSGKHTHSQKSPPAIPGRKIELAHLYTFSAPKFAQNKLGTLVKFYIPPLKLREKFAVLTWALRGGRNKFQLPFFRGRRCIGNKLHNFLSPRHGSRNFNEASATL